jgi:hypothetical protein
MAAMPGMGESPIVEAIQNLLVVSGNAQSCPHHICAQQPVLLKSDIQSFTNLDLSHKNTLLYSIPQEYAASSDLQERIARSQFPSLAWI